MLQWSLLFAVLALIAGLLGFFALEAAAATIAKVLLFVFLIMFVVSLFMGGRGRVV